jgi:hypothetical protein
VAKAATSTNHESWSSLRSDRVADLPRNGWPASRRNEWPASPESARAGEKAVKAALRVGLRPFLDSFLTGQASPSHKGRSKHGDRPRSSRDDVNPPVEVGNDPRGSSHEGGRDEGQGFGRRAGADGEPTHQAPEAVGFSLGPSSEAS